MTRPQATTINGICGLAGTYPVWLCDVWGVVHNGIRRFDAAVDALQRFRGGGGTVALLTNAPRPASSVEQQLTELGIPARAYDLVVTSGDVTRDLIASSRITRIHHLGPDRDLPFFAGLDTARVGLGEAEAVVCTGLEDDENQTPEDYCALFAEFKRRGLSLYCANPDRVVRRGEALFYCAGALADLYREIGGAVIVAGKPHPPIYRKAMDAVAEIRGAVPDSRHVLVIGDGIETDMAGAAARQLDAVFITGGIHADELAAEPQERAGTAGPSHLQRRLQEVAGLNVVAILPELSW